MDLAPLLQPRSIAVVGATSRPGAYADETLRNLRRVGFRGRVWGVHPTRRRVHRRTCVPSVADLPDPVDAVVVAIPAAGVPEVIDQAGARGCGGAVVYAAGFGETREGERLDEELRAAAARHELPVCGPNCDGIVALHDHAALWGDAFVPREAGHVAVVSQSGNVAVNALAARRGLRLHTVVSCGNQAVVDAGDWLHAAAQRDGVRSVAVFLESDGDGARLCEALALCADSGIGVAVLKVGAAAAGASAAAAHTGAVAGDHAAFRALVEEAGGAWPVWGYVRGGMGMVSFALADAAREAGAVLACGVAVAAIERRPASSSRTARASGREPCSATLTPRWRSGSSRARTCPPTTASAWRPGRCAARWSSSTPRSTRCPTGRRRPARRGRRARRSTSPAASRRPSARSSRASAASPPSASARSTSRPATTRRRRRPASTC
jgi:predicted CoA-binding protein